MVTTTKDKKPAAGKKTAKPAKAVKEKKAVPPAPVEQAEPPIENIDPLALYGQETEYKSEPATFRPDTEAASDNEGGAVPESKQISFADEFDEDTDFDESEETDVDTDVDTAGDGEGEMSAAEMAKFYVEFYDVAQTPIIKGLYKKKLFTKEELRKAQEIHKLWKAGKKKDGDADELALMTRYKDLMDLMKDVPLDNDEKKQLTVPLTACLKKWKGSLPPEALLMMAFGQITVSRLTPLFVL